MSPVKNAPLRPNSRKWNMGKYPNFNLAGIIDEAEKMETANPDIAVSNTSTVERVSATKVIPNGASQFPACTVWVPLFQMKAKTKAEIIIFKMLPLILIIRCSEMLFHENINIKLRSI